MDRKTPLLELDVPATLPPRSSRIDKRLRLGLCTIAVLILLCLIPSSPTCTYPGPLLKHVSRLKSDEKVPLEVHIMSKCPDAKDCLETLIVPTMEKVADKVDFNLSFIGKTTDEDDGVECMHGSSECLGNILELCAASIYPDPKLYLGFAMCLTHSYEDIPARSLVADCALEHGLEFEKLNGCASDDDGARGIELLRASVERSAKLNVTRSCTVRLNNEVRCVRDGGEWKDCDAGSSVDSLVDDIKALYEK